MASSVPMDVAFDRMRRYARSNNPEATASPRSAQYEDV
jgi:hypothetical protein